MKRYFYIFLTLTACISKSITPKEIFEGTWQYNPKLISDTLSIDDDFDDSKGHITEYVINSDSGWYKHTYVENQALNISKTSVYFCMKFEFLEKSLGRISTFQLDSLTQPAPDMLAFQELTYGFQLNDSIVLLVDTNDGSEFRHQYKVLNKNRVIWDGDTLMKINVP